jgi:hypothetical protein
MKPQLTGQKLADKFVVRHPLAEENPGKVWALYQGGGWITLRGESLRPHHDLISLYGEGWSLTDHIRAGQARKDIKNNHRRLREKYKAAGYGKL